MRDATAPNLPCTLTRAELDQCDPRPSGGRIRALCPFHGSDHQRSLSVDPATGRWRCFACQRWGHVTGWAGGTGARPVANGTLKMAAAAPKTAPRPLPAGLRSRVQEWHQALREATSTHPAAAYLRERAIPLAVAVGNGWGACRGEEWPGRRDAPELVPWRVTGCWVLVAPTWTPGTDSGHWQPVNIYARVAASGVKPRHDFLPGGKGVLLARPVEQVHPEMALVEGPADALAFAAAGYRAVAILGASPAGVPWGALPSAPLVIATDYDSSGRGAATRLLVAALRADRDACILASAWYDGAKDAAELLARRGGTLPALRYAEPPPARAPALAEAPRPAPAPPRPSLPAVALAARPAPVAPAARAAPAETLVAQVARWAAERCRRTTEFSASLDGLLRDFREWAGAVRVDRAAFAAALEGLGVRVLGGAVVVGVVLNL